MSEKSESTLRRIELILCIIVGILIVIAITGCQSQTKWGEGDPSLEWQGFFGNTNIARLDFVQTNTINSLGQSLAELTERVRIIEEAAIYDPNFNPSVNTGD